ncbi:cytochrome c oxidase assembly protein [Paenibacillus apiarius]|uniref:cytochrome c oxidase assembly protein n=1 Tax=Paenibacillus apiarius TaxID=46240 RepID=UPI00197FAC25|nr:cytochrome c oxidase assembly protein [Paenibacillus apiarius]
MKGEHMNQGGGFPFELTLAFLFMLLIVSYMVAAVLTSRRHKPWPLRRSALWIIGVLCAAAAIIGPLANDASIDFTAHMVTHLLLGMLAPLLMVLAAPVTLLLRTLSVNAARRLSRLLKSLPVRIVSDPVAASILNVGGLWILYTTGLYAAMHHNILLHAFVHVHVFLSGYLFTVSMIYIDPAPHRSSFVYRAIVLVMALAGHGILSKRIYAQPPAGVPAAEAEIGGILMYYGGDAIDLVLIFILCYQWFRAARPRSSLAMRQFGDAG